MIKTFKCKYTQQLFDGKYQKKFSQAVNKVGKRKLDMLNAAISWKDLKVPPSNHLENLQGELEGFCSIRINDQFRIVFRFDDTDICDVYITDYH
jgi:proteic killer suppression protein